jgi:hypothetical protein
VHPNLTRARPPGAAWISSSSRQDKRLPERQNGQMVPLSHGKISHIAFGTAQVLRAACSPHEPRVVGCKPGNKVRQVRRCMVKVLLGRRCDAPPPPYLLHLTSPPPAPPQPQPHPHPHPHPLTPRMHIAQGHAYLPQVVWEDERSHHGILCTPDVWIILFCVLSSLWTRDYRREQSSTGSSVPMSCANIVHTYARSTSSGRENLDEFVKVARRLSDDALTGIFATATEAPWQSTPSATQQHLYSTVQYNAAP